MRKLLVISVLALLAGAAVIWLLQQGSGYVLISLGDTSIEMSALVAGAIYVLLTGFLLWSLLAVRWLTSAGGIRLWWNGRRSAKQRNKTAQGLLLYADQDWQKASLLLSQSADRSSMPVVNLLFAARAAADSNEPNKARQLLQRLKMTHPKSQLLADKLLAELLIVDEKLDEAVLLLESLHRENPSDTGILRLLVDAYFLLEDWVMAQKLLADIKHYAALNKRAIKLLELDIYTSLLAEFVADPEFTEQEQQGQLAELWEMLPQPLRKVPEVIVQYADALAAVNGTDKLQPLLTKALNNEWHPDLIDRFGGLQTSKPEKQLSIGEKWLPAHSDDAGLLLALGRICGRLGLTGKAKDYLTSAVSLEPSPQNYLELAELLGAMGENKASATVYRDGLRAGLKESE
ncbi:MAG: heme biosynthesis HemY N-terminal domain-containing protein [Porticoccaceae bacterium]|nr:heme biosynthesis HemY N-terminal domain-containing protein [Porticoccaceae bacterium]